MSRLRSESAFNKYIIITITTKTWIIHEYLNFIYSIHSGFPEVNKERKADFSISTICS